MFASLTGQANNRRSAPASNTRRQSFGQRLSLGLGLAGQRAAFTVDEAKSAQATDLALRIGNKDPSLPCLNDVSVFASAINWLN